MHETPVSCGSGPDPDLSGHLYATARPRRRTAGRGPERRWLKLRQRYVKSGGYLPCSFFRIYVALPSEKRAKTEQL